MAMAPLGLLLGALVAPTPTPSKKTVRAVGATKHAKAESATLHSDVKKGALKGVAAYPRKAQPWYDQTASGSVRLSPW